MTHRLEGGGWTSRCGALLVVLVGVLACDTAAGGEMVVVDPGWIVGDLLISVSDGAGGIGLLVDPRSYDAAVIRAPAGHPLRFLSHATVRDSSLYVLTMDGIRIYRMRHR